MGPDWQFVEQNETGWIVRRGDLTYRVAPNGEVYVRYYKRHPQTKANGAHGSIAERRLKGSGIMAISARHAAHYLSKEAA